MKARRNFILGAVGAGFLIGLASAAYCRLGGALGAALFGLGLLVVLIEQVWLFTGRVGYVNRSNYRPTLACLPFNLLGAILCGVFASLAFGSDLNATVIAGTKLLQPTTQTFFRAVFCGFCMVTAVESWKRASSTLGVLLSVFIFVASGFEHCVADAFYFAAGSMDRYLATAQLPASIGYTAVARFLVVAILGNSAGSILLKALLPKQISYR